MRREKKERLIVAVLWCLLAVSGVYVFMLLFPAAGQRLGKAAKTEWTKTVQKASVRLMFEATPLVPYLLEGKGETKASGRNPEDLSYEWYQSLVKNGREGQEGTGEEQEGAGEEQSASPEPKEGESVTAAADQAETIAAAAAVSALDRMRALSQKGGYSLEQMMSCDYLLQNLYVISAGTSITPNELNPEELLSMNLGIEKTGDYQILIYHTHSQEAYADSVPGDVSQTVVGMGELLAQCLEEYGYSVLHHKGIYDMTDGELDRDPAYTKALPVISSILEAHPEIQVVIDLHRDGVKEDVHLVTEIDGKQTARIMYFNGLCRDEAGERTDISNPFRRENMAMSLQLALTTMAEYPGLTRCIYLRSSRYNLHLRPRSALIEVGAQTNTVEEVQNAIPIVANVLDQILGNP